VETDTETWEDGRGGVVLMVAGAVAGAVAPAPMDGVGLRTAARETRSSPSPMLDGVSALDDAVTVVALRRCNSKEEMLRGAGGANFNDGRNNSDRGPCFDTCATAIWKADNGDDGPGAAVVDDDDGEAGAAETCSGDATATGSVSTDSVSPGVAGCLAAGTTCGL